MYEDIGADEYKIEDNEKDYTLRIGSTDDKININISTRDKNQFKNYSGEFTLDDLRRINRVFLLTSSIYEAKEEFKKAVERRKIAISERDDYIHTVFYMMIGTDTSTLSVALPRDETPRIIRLEQNLNILKLGRDNLSDRLAVFEREADEIKQELDSVQLGNSSLHQIADTIGQGIPDVSEILHDYKAGRKVQNYSSSYNKNQFAQQYPQQYQNIQNNQNQNQEEDFPYSSSGIKQADLPYGSSGIKNLDTGYGNFGTIKESLREQNRDSSIPNEKENENNKNNFELDEKNIEENNPSEDSKEYEKFNNGILKDIIKEQEEIELVVNKISEKYPGSTYRLLYKGSRDGDGANDFHSKCDEAEKTLIIVEDNYGNRFGGFTTQDWGGQYLQKKDDEAFIFSIDKKKVYDVIPNQNAIGCYPNFGPVFFGCQIRIYDNFLTKGGTTYKKGLNYYTTEDFELTNGNQNFGVRDIEVYEVESQ
jgi:hypothetical protein